MGIRESISQVIRGSYLLDTDGNPLTVYRGVGGRHWHETNLGMYIWTDVPEIAAVYGEKGTIHAAHLIIRNPFYFSNHDEPVIVPGVLKSQLPPSDELDRVISRLFGSNDYVHSFEVANDAVIRDIVRKSGYDSLIGWGYFPERVTRPENTSWDGSEDMALEYWLYSKDQVVPTPVKRNTAPPAVSIPRFREDEISVVVPWKRS
jgi:hypothetical protein